MLDVGEKSQLTPSKLKESSEMVVSGKNVRINILHS
jgi:hypothetical protein